MSIDTNKDKNKRFKMVEYAYYRLYLFFKWFKRDDLPQGTAAIFLASQILFSLVIIAKLFNIQIIIDKFETIGGVLMIYNIVSFNSAKKLQFILEKYKDETKDEKLYRGTIVYGLFLLTHIIGGYLYIFP